MTQPEVSDPAVQTRIGLRMQMSSKVYTFKPKGKKTQGKLTVLASFFI